MLIANLIDLFVGIGELTSKFFDTTFKKRKKFKDFFATIATFISEEKLVYCDDSDIYGSVEVTFVDSTGMKVQARWQRLLGNPLSSGIYIKCNHPDDTEYCNTLLKEMSKVRTDHLIELAKDRYFKIRLDPNYENGKQE